MVVGEGKIDKESERVNAGEAGCLQAEMVREMARGKCKRYSN